LGSLYLERVLGYDPLEIGLAFLPVALVIGILSVGFSERLVMRFGAKPVLLVGQVLIVAGLVLFALSPVHSSYLGDLLAPMLLLGVGAGLSFPSLMGLAMSSATQADSGLASGLVNTSLQVGGALGLAVLATLSATRTDNLLASGSSPHVREPHGHPVRGRQLGRRPADQRFPPRLLDRRGTRGGGGRRHRAHRSPALAG